MVNNTAFNSASLYFKYVFEDSSRTHTSFEMVERKLGLTVIPFDPAHSSVNKGETLYDTSLIMDAVGVNIEVIRHSQNEYYYQDLIHPKKHQHLNIGVINAGDDVVDNILVNAY